MNWWVWKPKHTLTSVARNLAQGLRDGSVSLERTNEEQLEDSLNSKLIDAEFELILLSARDEQQSVLQRLDVLERRLDEISANEVDLIRVWLVKAKLWGRRSDCLEPSARVRALESAIGLLDKVIHTDPDNTLAWYNRACYQASLGRKNEAMHDLQRAMRVTDEPAFVG